MLHELFLALIVSVDIYLIAAAYCNSGIKIPITSAVVITLIGAGVMGVSLLISGIAGTFISPGICRTLGIIVLTTIGVVTVFKSLVRILVRRLTKNGELSLHTGSSGLVIKLYLDDTAADVDNSMTLSPAEAVSLAVASSLDCAATGLGSGFCHVSPLRTALFTFVAGFIAIAAGNLTGKKISSSEHDLSWLGGVLLIAFAVFEALT